MDKRGRVWINMSNDGKTRKTKLAHIMLITFVGPAKIGQVARHLDDNPGNNRLENLTWGTQSENMADKVANGLHWNTNKTHCKNGHPFDEKNTGYRTDGKRRYCRACAAERARAKRAKKPAI